MHQANIAPPRTRFLRDAIVLGLMTALGPFAIDMYLPSLPSIGATLNASPDAVLLSMTGFFITFALGHLIYGPLSDMFGRKPPVYVGIGLFAIASVGCALATDINGLIIFRIIQGFGGAAGIVIARAIVRDLHSGVNEARLLSLLMLVFSVSPLLAPSIGSQIIQYSNWRMVFWVVAVLAVLGLGMAVLFVRETRPIAMRSDRSIGAVLQGCRILLLDRKFMGMSMIGGFALAGFFAFLANSSFVMMGHYHLSPEEFSLVFSANAASFFFASQFTGWLAARFGLVKIVKPALVGYGLGIATMFALAMAGVDNYFLLGAFFLISNAFLGIVMPVTSVLAMADHGPIAGTASSLLGTLQLATGAIVMAISGAIADGTVAPMIEAIAGCGLMTCLLGWATFAGRKEIPVAP
jgi:DHA1 family bicyclomycin/chloramphenicol resistance-like MFS transporter